MSLEQSPPALDRADTRVRHDDGIGGAIRGFLDRMRSGDLGMVPVAVGVVIISVVFTSLNPIFLAPNNLVNLLFDCATVGFIALGVVCVLMLGEIDLSIGSMSGLASAVFGTIWGTHGWPVGIAIACALMVGVAVGALYAVLHLRLGMPSFVATLAGLLALLGLQLYLLGNAGSINLPYQSPMVRFGQILMIPEWLSYVLGLLPGLFTIVVGTGTIRRRRAANLSAGGMGGVAFKAVILTAAILAAVYYLNLGRGVPWMFGAFIAVVMVMEYAFTRTQWGRAMLAVGGNREAARRAGIKVGRIYASAFILCSVFASLGGVLAASRLASSSQQAGTGDVNLNAIAAAVIGGTSLFGGRGSAYSALLGVIVIQLISNGLTLLSLSSSLRYMITGAVLAIAVIVDSLARQTRASHGRG